MRRTKNSLRYLLDTNILLRLYSPSDPQHLLVKQVILSLIAETHHIFIVPQNLYELWNVATRPAASNGFGLTTDKAQTMQEAAINDFVLKRDTAALYDEWLGLVTHYNVQGKQVHDTRLVAAMKVHKLTHLLTLNPGDFTRFASEIVVVPPSSVKVV